MGTPPAGLAQEAKEGCRVNLEGQQGTAACSQQVELVSRGFSGKAGPRALFSLLACSLDLRRGKGSGSVGGEQGAGVAAGGFAFSLPLLLLPPFPSLPLPPSSCATAEQCMRDG